MKIIKKSTLKRYIDSCVKREVTKRFSDLQNPNKAIQLIKKAKDIAAHIFLEGKSKDNHYVVGDALERLYDIQQNLEDSIVSLKHNEPKEAKDLLLSSIKEAQKASGSLLANKSHYLERIKNPTSNKQRRSQNEYVSYVKKFDSYAKEIANITKVLRSALGMFGANS